MPKQTWYFVAIFTALVVAALTGVSTVRKGKELRLARAESEEARAAVETANKLAAEWARKLETSQTRVDQLKKEKDAVTEAQRNLEREMRAALESKEITISELQGKLTVNILDRILFDSGEATLKPEGEAVLRKIAAVLAEYPHRQVHVIGHTDNVPIRAAARGKYASNWELSTVRATAAVRFLSEKAGVDPRRLGAVGYGEFRPIADNSTTDGRSRNRRIALVVLSEELVGSDAAPLAAPAPPADVLTNPPPALGATNLPPAAVPVTNLPPAESER